MSLTKQERVAIRRAAKLCISMAAEQIEGFIMASPADALRERCHAHSDFSLPDGTRVSVSLHVSVWPSKEPRRPLMIEGPR